MPRKIRELKALLRKAGCVCENVRGSHAKWSHPEISDKLILSGNDGADAKPYQEKMVANYLRAISVNK
ncbi:MAG: type II toxin-antitoxin system HicA family toxin [Gammaproteobacteria bacterium]|nr:type II toxin-antitoxin system HicA family toxin [Gammaproteobacteria bacterium]MDD9800797.1 type II toxin-antitoxin system HicA family toxin [Gammaproteobacteria bacterium]MDD9814942.1 type II toxin-antitoxin system HicA family toxin [Gammaproteobacteria bacterium]MDD9851642.1 type II toxin-antitoxin system HicA family toxin [Gammaproteobacteria bacterium]